MLSYAEMAAELMDHLIDHAAHGYSQWRRDGDGTTETITLTDGTEVSIHGGDYDCSEAVRMCYAAVGPLAEVSHMWTGSEVDILLSHGFKEVDISDVQRGDVLFRDGHTELYLGNNSQGGARIDETGGITGPTTGDQTGQEIARSLFRPTTWTRAFRCTWHRYDPFQEEEDMACIIQPNGENYLWFYDGHTIHPLAHPDELGAINMVYKATHDGQGIPCIKLGQVGAPWATRFQNAVERSL